MFGFRDPAGTARRRLLPEGRVAGPMPWVVAIMMCLTVLAAAAGIGFVRGQFALGDALAGRVTIQVVEADAQKRAAAMQALVLRLRGMKDVRHVQPVAQETLVAQLQPWLGTDLAQDELPIPGLIDLDLAPGDRNGQLKALGWAARQIASTARVQPHAEYLQPLTALMKSLGFMALAIVMLMALATGAVVILAARAAHSDHKPTIETLHLMGATDVQIARLFQRRIALDALLGGITGFMVATALLLLLRYQAGAIGSELIGAVTLPPWAWPALALLPLLGVGLAMLTARMTVIRALRRGL